MRDSPKSLHRTLDLELRGRTQHPWYRRLGLAILGLIVVAALLNVFGQESSTTVAVGREATLSVDAPSHLRGGLLFQARFEIEASHPLAKPRLVLSPGWFDAMTLNSTIPSPVAENSGPEGVSMTFEPLPAGDKLILWTDWQVNPTNVGRRTENATLYDGLTSIASAHRTVTVFP